MTTIAQVKRAVRPLLVRNPDLTIIGREIVLTPVNHLLRSVFIERSVFDHKAFMPEWKIVPLFEVRFTSGTFWARRFYDYGKVSWDVDDADTPEAMSSAIENVALATLRAARTIDAFPAFATEDRFPNQGLDSFPLHKMVVDVARGDLEAARGHYAWLDTPRAKWVPANMPGAYGRALQLKSLIDANDRAGLARLLHDWEAITVKNLKLEKYWQKTPFPLELSAG